MLLCFERGDEDGRAQIFREVARGDAYVPTTRAPFGEFVVGQGAGGDGVNGLAAILGLVGPELENERLARARGGLHHDILARTQRANGLLLPKVRDGDLVKGGRLGKLIGQRLHAQNIAELPELSQEGFL